MKKLTLAYIVNDGKILLGLKKRGFGQGWWNGFGGKVEEGERLEQAVKRELFEESGITALSMTQYALLEFHFQAEPDKVLEVHAFKISQWQGEPHESEEMKPEWFKLADIPFDIMWPSDKFWLPLFLQGEKLIARFTFNPDHQVLSHTVTKTENLDSPGHHES